MGLTITTKKITGELECDICKRTIEFEAPAEQSGLDLAITYDETTPRLAQWEMRQGFDDFGLFIFCPKCRSLV